MIILVQYHHDITEEITVPPPLLQVSQPPIK